MVGNTDTPIMKIGSDEFQIGPYIEGLSDFVRECQTPMTVAVQGSWDCGKTSVMNIVRDRRRQGGGILDIWFNTWQFFQLNMDERLAVTFLLRQTIPFLCIITGTERKRHMFIFFTPFMGEDALCEN